VTDLTDLRRLEAAATPRAEIRQAELDRLNKTIVDLSKKFGFLHGFLGGLKFRVDDDEVVKLIDAALKSVDQPGGSDGKA